MWNFQKIIIGFLILGGLLGFSLVNAAIVPCIGSDPCTLCHLWELGDKIIKFITIQLVLPIAGLLFVVAGGIFLFSGGNEQRVALAKSIFYNTVVGLLIVFVSWLLIDTLFKTIASGTFKTIWNEIPICSQIMYDL
ncbi:MAG: hypothetical protein CMI55_04230 [Parcubacteria group bacterium]|nr:hypothetical protein [Parcubacteria group bacterium]|tara:strand:+ start:12804 stop:13211 length:408 start_codon:yes stop_codon:yes gene_type:complete